MQKKSIILTLLGRINEVGGNTILLEDLEYDVKVLGNPKSILYNTRLL